jgi:excinuclease ABC subunit C
LHTEGKKLPQLIIIDGGKGQLSAANAALQELGLQGRTTLIGLAKNEEEIFFTGDSQSLRLSMNSPSLTFIRKVRDEVHRFGIGFHRKQRSRGTFKNELETIPGIGKMTAQALLRQFRSVKRVSNSTLDALETVVGKKAAERIYRHFHTKENEQPGA